MPVFPPTFFQNIFLETIIPFLTSRLYFPTEHRRRTFKARLQNAGRSAHHQPPESQQGKPDDSTHDSRFPPTRPRGNSCRVLKKDSYRAVNVLCDPSWKRPELKIDLRLR